MGLSSAINTFWKILAGSKSSPAAAVTEPRSSVQIPPTDKSNASADILAVSRQAILFRQHFPPRHDGSTLSFFGGAPVAPRGFRWPGPDGSGAQARPFSFVMQIDCAAVPARARLGLLPDRGVLYFFLDLTWGEPNHFRVLYEGRPDTDWAAARPPDDLGPAFGDQARHVWKWTQSADDCPNLLPRWTFDPVAIEIPADAYDPDEREEEDAGAPWLWPGDKALAETLRRAQGEDVSSTPFSVQDVVERDGTIRRPFANYPHDWRAVQICSGLVRDRLRQKHHLAGTAALRALSEGERDALVIRVSDEALAWFNRAGTHPPFAAVPEKESDHFWSWLAENPSLVRFVVIDALTLSVEASLVDSKEAAGRIPPDVARRVHNRHALAVQTANGLFTTTPHRMLAPPVDVQGNQWDRAKTHLLLLEISSNEGLGHHFGEGVYQFWITPADLKARRFEKVELTSDAY